MLSNEICSNCHCTVRAAGASNAMMGSGSSLLSCSRVGGTYNWRVHGGSTRSLGALKLLYRAHRRQPELDNPLSRPQRLLDTQQQQRLQVTVQQQRQKPTRRHHVLIEAQQQQPSAPQPSQLISSAREQQHQQLNQPLPYHCAISQSDNSYSAGSRPANANKGSTGGSSGNDQCDPTPEPPSGSGSPPTDDAGNSSSTSSNIKPSQRSSTATSSMADTDVDAVVDKMLDKTWQELKRDLKKEMSPEQAAMIDSWDVSDIQTDKVFRDIAEQQLGPILQMMGIREDPYDFFIDMVKIALALQLGTAGLVFYGAELGLGLDAGDGFRAVAGLALGYFLRLGIKIEHLAWPLYNAFVQLLIRDDAVYEIPAATPEDRQDTLNKLGLAIACAFLVPKFLFGWQNDDCWQIVVPMVGGLFLFDVCYLVALLFKIWGHEDRHN